MSLSPESPTGRSSIIPIQKSSRSSGDMHITCVVETVTFEAGADDASSHPSPCRKSSPDFAVVDGCPRYTSGSYADVTRKGLRRGLVSCDYPVALTSNPMAAVRAQIAKSDTTSSSTALSSRSDERSLITLRDTSGMLEYVTKNPEGVTLHSEGAEKSVDSVLTKSRPDYPVSRDDDGEFHRTIRVAKHVPSSHVPRINSRRHHFPDWFELDPSAQPELPFAQPWMSDSQERESLMDVRGKTQATSPESSGEHVDNETFGTDKEDEIHQPLIQSLHDVLSKIVDQGSEFSDSNYEYDSEDCDIFSAAIIVEADDDEAYPEYAGRSPSPVETGLHDETIPDPEELPHEQQFSSTRRARTKSGKTRAPKVKKELEEPDITEAPRRSAESAPTADHHEFLRRHSVRPERHRTPAEEPAREHRPAAAFVRESSQVPEGGWFSRAAGGGGDSPPSTSPSSNSSSSESSSSGEIRPRKKHSKRYSPEELERHAKKKKAELKARKKAKKALKGVKINPPSRWNGRPHLDSFDQWMYEVDTWRDLHGLDEQTTIKLLVNFLSGNASRFFMTHVATRRRDWTLRLIYEGLFDYCFPEDFKRKLRWKLMHATQGSRKVRDFVRELEHLAERFPDVNHQHLVEIFWQGLEPYLQFALLEKGLDPESSGLEALVEQAARSEKAYSQVWRLKRQYQDRSDIPEGQSLEHDHRSVPHQEIRYLLYSRCVFPPLI